MADMSTEKLEQIEKAEKEFFSMEGNIRETQDFEEPQKLYEELIESVRISTILLRIFQ